MDFANYKRMQIYNTTGTTGLEPATFGVTGQHSNLLNYIPFFLTLFLYLSFNVYTLPYRSLVL